MNIYIAPNISWGKIVIVRHDKKQRRGKLLLDRKPAPSPSLKAPGKAGGGGASFSVGLLIGPERRPGGAVYAEPGRNAGPMISPERGPGAATALIGESFTRA